MRDKLKLIGNILVIVSFLFIIRYFYEMDIDLKILCNYRIILIIAFGSILATISVFLLAYAWKKMLQYLADKKISYKETAKIYAKANIGKYIPGNVMHFIERNVFLSKSGLGQIEMAVSTISEIAGQVVAAVMIGLLLSAKNLWNVIVSVLDLKISIVLVMLLGMVLSVFFFWCKKEKRIQLILKKIFTLQFCKISLVNILLYGLSMFLLAIIMCGVVAILKGNSLTIGEIFLVINIYAISWVVGFVVPGAPGGIGVREFVFIYLTRENELSNYIILAAVIHRLITVLGDVSAYICSKFIEKHMTRSERGGLYENCVDEKN